MGVEGKPGLLGHHPPGPPRQGSGRPRPPDFHDIGRGRGGVAGALRRVVAPSLILSIDSDTLYAPYQQEAIRDALAAQGTPVEYAVIHSPHGHDAFLLEIDQVSEALVGFLAEVEKNHD